MLASSGGLSCTAESCDFDGTVLGCNDLGGDDRIVVDGGSGNPVRVHCADDVTMADADVGITVTAEDTWRCTVDASTQALDVAVGAEGFVCESGSTCSFRGAVRTPGGLATVLPNRAAFRVGEILPCPHGNTADCSQGDPSRVRFRYPSSKYGPFDGAGDTRLDEAIDAIRAGEDFLCFFNVYGSDPPYAPGELNHCFDVVATSGEAEDPQWIEIDLLQGKREVARQPHSRRRIYETQLTEEVPAGPTGREIRVENGVIPSLIEDWFDGAWLLFEEGSTGEPQTIPYRSQNAEPDADEPDRFQLLDLRGPRQALPAGTKVWIGLALGFQEGDRFDVVAPARIVSAVEDKTGYPSQVFLDGDLTLEFSKLEDLGFVEIRNCPTSWDHVWIEDTGGPSLGGNGTESYITTYLAGDCSFGHTLLTGTDSNADEGVSNDGHGWVAAGDGTTDVHLTIRDLTARYLGDDCFDILNPNSIDAVTFTGLFRCEYISGGADSANYFDTGHQEAELQVEAGLCSNCTRNGDLSDRIVTGVLKDSSTINDLYVIGGKAEPGGLVHYRNFSIVGSESTGIGNWIRSVENAVFRENQIHNEAYMVSPFGTARNVYAKDLQGSRGLQLIDDTVIDNWMLEDWKLKTAAGEDSKFAVVNSGYSNWSFRRFSMVQDDVSPTVQLLVWLNCGSGGANFTFGELLVDGHQAGSANDAVIRSGGHLGCWETLDLQYTGGFCRYDSQDHTRPGQTAALEASALELVDGTDPGYEDAAADLFAPTADGEAETHACGALGGSDSPGVHRFTVAHSVNKTLPECSSGHCAAGTPGVFYVSADGGDDFRFANLGDDPPLELQRGQVYAFHVDSPGHPFTIVESLDGSESPDGLMNNGSERGSVFFEVPLDAPETLYYRSLANPELSGVIQLDEPHPLPMTLAAQLTLALLFAFAGSRRASVSGGDRVE